MSRVLSRSTRGVASSPAVAGFRPAAAALAIAAAFALQPLALQAQPTGAQAIHGAATLSQTGSNLVITTRNGAGTSHSAINWQSFSVPAGSLTQFVQPSASSTSINRVVGSDPSAIFGTLSSNGRLVLVNPHGITVGKGAVVDTAGFTASTVLMSQADAIAGRLLFGGDGGAGLRVDGHIVAREGDVVLIAPNVETGSEAVIRSNGATILAAGRKVEITGRGLEGIRMEVQAGTQAVNLGTLKGDAVGIFAGTLRHSGLVQAQALSAEGGKVVLKATGGDALVSGAITAGAADGKGGRVDVLGQRVGLLAGANIDASGAAGGGSVRIGGDYQGQNAQVPNALRTYVDAQATIRADATQQGDGGRVIVWSDELTRMHGQVSARGGAQGGDGGWAEVSGKRQLEFTGLVDLQAPQGAAGLLLLDPEDVTIAHSPSISSVNSLPSPSGVLQSGTEFAPSSANPVTISDAHLNAQLAVAHVQVKTSSSLLTIVSSGGGQITLNPDAVVTWNTASHLSLLADKGITLNGSIRATNAAASLHLQALNGGIHGTGTSKIEVAQLFAWAANTGANGMAGRVLLEGLNKIDVIAGKVDGVGAAFTAVNLQPWSATKSSVTVGSVYNEWGSASGIVGDGTNPAVITLKTSVGGLEVADTTIDGKTVFLETALGGDLALHAGADVKANAGSLTLKSGRDVLIAGNAGVEGLPTTTLQAQELLSIEAEGGVAVGDPEGSNSYVQLQGGGGVGKGVLIRAKAGDADLGQNTSVDSLLSPLTVEASGSILGWASLSTHGSSSADGMAGAISLTATNGSIEFGAIHSNGSYSDYALHGGNISLTALKGSVSGGTVSAWGGQGYGRDGGKGGTIRIDAGDAVDIALIEAYGGGGSQGGAGQEGDVGSQGGAGGKGGDVHIRFGGSYVGTVVATGGAGGTGSDTGSTGGAGGAGGNIRVEQTAGDLVADGNVALYAQGGAGGDAAFDLGGFGGAGGSGGKLTLSSVGGSVSLQGVTARAAGGIGGYDSDDSTRSAAGSMGTFSALGASVEILGDFNLDAVWTNSGTVNARGTSWLYGDGVLRNAGQLNLYDSALVDASVHNAGSVTAIGSAVAAKIASNTGLIDVRAGSTLTATGFVANSGTVQVDGTLDLAAFRDVCVNCEQLVAAASLTGPTFANSGLLTGNGTVIVAGGDGTVDNFGTIAPGRVGSVGTLSINGNLVMEPGSMFAVDLASTSSFDILNVQGTATTGSTISASSPGFAEGDLFAVLQAGTLDAATLPTVNLRQLTATVTGPAELALVAAAPYPSPDAQQVADQVVIFSQLFAQTAQQQQQQDKKDTQIGKDDIVITETACTPS